MKCQQCAKSAVFHITELEAGSVRELHLCEDHARAYLTQGAAQATGAPGESTTGGGAIGPTAIGKTADDLETLDRKACDMCGITFFEFRNQGRLGCPHDYVQFEKELEPLIANIHGATEHVGCKSATHPTGTDSLSLAIGMRRQIQEAISTEDYEKAKELRDAIRSIDDLIGGAVVELPVDGVQEQAKEPPPPSAAPVDQPTPRPSCSQPPPPPISP
ncbi:MAG: UvrB/UvrC motif-containing protein [Planctomycetaceae bacterium]